MTQTQPGIIGTLWVCQDCMIYLANDEHSESPDREPLSLIPDDHDLTLGLDFDEHECEDPGNVECDCERKTFSWSPCEGCGSHLGGERHAVTEWQS